MKVFQALLLAGLSGAAQAQIYKCTGADGKVNFTDSPCQATEQAQAIDRVPLQGLDKMRQDIEQSRAESKRREAEYLARQAERERLERQMYWSRKMHEGLRIGMTASELEDLPHWKHADSYNTTQTAGGVREQRVYRTSYDNEYERMYLYIVNGVLAVIQD